MKIAVLGASGGCGRQLVEQAARRGHTVTAVARTTSKLEVPPGVKVDRGDLTSAEFLRGVVKGQDAVVSALGLRMPGLAPWHRPEDGTFLSRSTAALLEAMKAEGTRRVLAISAGGVGDSAALVPGFFRWMIKLTALKTAYAQLADMERQLFESGLDVCVPRPTGLTDGPLTNKAVTTRALVGRATISRADVAAWMLDQLDRPSFAERAPIITVTGAA
ncbi:MAG: NAD(P)H-binding protein [Myxococcaceae bacterium]|nr:NAD(P)H-binding protein [Myxococcaceae bacterium]